MLNIKNNRIAYIDFFRGAGILLMIMGHVKFGPLFDKFIHAFHMPMFFFISGYLYSERDESVSNIIKRKARTLLLPYLSIGILHYVVWLIINWDEKSAEPLIHLLSYNTEGVPIAGALWFLTALFIADILFYIIHRYVRKISVQGIICVTLAGIGNIFSLYLEIELPFALNAALVGLGLYYAGYYIKKTGLMSKIENFLLKVHSVIGGLTACITLILIFLNDLINMRTGAYNYVVLFWINALSSSVLGLFFSKQIYDMNKLPKFIHTACKYIESIGRNSIVYVCLNQLVIYLLKVMIARSGILMPLICNRILVLMFTMLFLEIAITVIEKTKLGFLFGKRQK